MNQEPHSSSGKSPIRLRWLVLAIWAVNLLIMSGAAYLVFRDGNPFEQAALREVPGNQNSANSILPATGLATQSAPSTPSPISTNTLQASPTVTHTFTVTPTKTPTRTPTVSLTPELIGKAQVIGYSVLGRPIEVYRFGIGSRQRMIVAGIHGGSEWNTITLADQIIAYLKKNPQTVPVNITLYILRSLNPDGEARAMDFRGRLNENGVDLNRNFDAFWKSTWSRNGCWNELPVSPGPSPDSEPETRALQAFLASHKVGALINYHSAALGIFPGGQPPDHKSTTLAEEIFAAAPVYAYPPLDTGCKYTGQLIDWASKNDIAAVDIELSNHRDIELETNLKILKVFLNWGR
jgi:hypothetical protein